MSKLTSLPELFSTQIKYVPEIPHNQIFIFFKLQAEPNKLRHDVSNEILHELASKVRVTRYQAGDKMPQIGKNVEFSWVFNGFVSIDKRVNPEKRITPWVDKENKLELGMGELWSPMAWMDNNVTFLEDTVFLEVSSTGIEECGLEASSFMFHASLFPRSISPKKKKTKENLSKDWTLSGDDKRDMLPSRIKMFSSHKLG